MNWPGEPDFSVAQALLTAVEHLDRGEDMRRNSRLTRWSVGTLAVILIGAPELIFFDDCPNYDASSLVGSWEGHGLEGTQLEGTIGEQNADMRLAGPEYVVRFKNKNEFSMTPVDPEKGTGTIKFHRVTLKSPEQRD